MIRLVLRKLELVREELDLLALLLTFDLQVSLHLVQLIILELVFAETAHVLLRYALDLIDLLTVRPNVLLDLLH